MQQTVDEGLRVINNIPLPVDCLIMSNRGNPGSWDNRRMHYHEYIEILYPLKGDFDVMLNGEIYSLQEHSMFVINAMEPHCTRPAREEERSLLCIKFMPQVLYSSKQSVTEMEYSIPYVFKHFGSKRLFEQELLTGTIVPGEFEYVRGEKEQLDFGHELAIRSSVLRIFAWIIRYWHNHATNPDIPPLDNHIAQTIRTIRDYVEQNYAEATLSAAADACGLSYSYFSRVFNNYMKTSFSDYVNLTRVNQALRLLASTDMSITEIALSVGFSSTSYFIQTFRKHKNISPNKFRKMFHGEGE